MNFTPSHSSPPDIMSAKPPPRHMLVNGFVWLAVGQLLEVLEERGDICWGVAGSWWVVSSNPLFRSFLGLRAYPTEQIIKANSDHSHCDQKPWRWDGLCSNEGCLDNRIYSYSVLLPSLQCQYGILYVPRVRSKYPYRTLLSGIFFTDIELKAKFSVLLTLLSVEQVV